MVYDGCMRSLLALSISFCLTSAHAQVWRCENTYSNTPCASGTQVDTSPALVNHSGPKTIVLNLCKVSASQQTWWLTDSCASRGWTLVRTERVPANIPWAQQLEVARGKHREAQALQKPPPVTRRSDNNSGKNERIRECKQLNERIDTIDNRARRGVSAHESNRLREERREIRDRQYRLRCQ